MIALTRASLSNFEINFSSFKYFCVFMGSGSSLQICLVFSRVLHCFINILIQLCKTMLDDISLCAFR